MEDTSTAAKYNEKSDTQKFWLALIRDVFGVINPEVYIDFEKRVLLDNVGFIDGYIISTGIVIEQKSPHIDLSKPQKQSDGAELTPFEQAKRYYDWLPVSQRGRYILVCNFTELHVHDMEYPKRPPTIIPVAELTRDNLGFLLVPGETLPIEVALSVKAGKLIDSLYKSIKSSLHEVIQPDSPLYEKAIDNINILLVRLVFLLYAEDSGLLQKNQFHDYLMPRRIMAVDALQQLFDVLKTKPEERYPFIDKDLAAFPYVNGGLFEKHIDFPQFSDVSLYIILVEMSERFNWAGISPTIFGAIFESTINETTRKTEGMHYTSIENIHKVIDPLFLDDLNAELNKLLSLPEGHEKNQSLIAFQDKLAALRFLDPSCGSGNFLTESFISLRHIENKIISALPENLRPPVKVSITQFHGIEVHDFAVNVARTALWISDHQMWKETVQITGYRDAPLPLKDYDHIKEGSAMDELPNLGWKLPGWKINHSDMLYIMGNPPFLGYSQQTPAQKADVRAFFGKAKSDYVSCWFNIASEYLSRDKNIKAAFVATNSITQGEQPAYVFNVLRERFGIKIDFAYQPFVWKNELPDQSKMAHVHIVIIGFSTCPPERRKLYSEDIENGEKKNSVKLVDNINFYLAEGPDDDVAVPTDKPVTENAPRIMLGNLPRDDGKLIIEGEDYADFIKREPGAEKYIKRYMMGNEFINNIPRYCLWLVDAGPDEIRKMPLVHARVEAVKKFRLASTREGTRKLAKKSWLFAEIRQPVGNYLVIPSVSSENRKYIPIGWLDDSVIAGNKLYTISDATLYDFGVLTSRVHMAWMRRVGGRLKSDYSYTNTIVYNTFAWPSPKPKQRERIEQTAQAILDARAKFPRASFAELYDDTLMPAELRKAHERNDAAVCQAYGWPVNISENEIVRELFKLYHSLTK